MIDVNVVVFILVFRIWRMFIGIGFLDRNVLHPMDQRILHLRERDESREVPRQDESVEIEIAVPGFDDGIVSDEGVGQGECAWGDRESSHPYPCS